MKHLTVPLIVLGLVLATAFAANTGRLGKYSSGIFFVVALAAAIFLCVYLGVL